MCGRACACSWALMSAAIGGPNRATDVRETSTGAGRCRHASLSVGAEVCGGDRECELLSTHPPTLLYVLYGSR